MSYTIRVLIVEREPLFRRGLASCLGKESGFVVVGSAATAEAGYLLAQEHRPKVVLVGTTLPDDRGLGPTRAFRRDFPSIGIVVVTYRESDDELLVAFRAGASAYCGQDIDEQKLLEFVRHSATGDSVINMQVLRNRYIVVQMIEQNRWATVSGVVPTSAFAPLSIRELEILKKVNDGLTYAEITSTLGISAQTIRNHVSSIIR